MTDHMQPARELPPQQAYDVLRSAIEKLSATEPSLDRWDQAVWVIATALAEAEQRGREEERERAAKFSQKWLEDWGMDLQATCDKYREASQSGRFDGRRIHEDMAKTFAHEFSERADAVYQCGEQLAAAIRRGEP